MYPPQSQIKGLTKTEYETLRERCRYANNLHQVRIVFASAIFFSKASWCDEQPARMLNIPQVCDMFSAAQWSIQRDERGTLRSQRTPKPHPREGWGIPKREIIGERFPKDVDEAALATTTTAYTVHHGERRGLHGVASVVDPFRALFDTKKAPTYKGSRSWMVAKSSQSTFIAASQPRKHTSM
ncbi:MAG: hypothetical protein M1493_17715 [Firmicutes bacterium]|uniref:Uncharacterized protein n=1 Tax=Sulfobacillus benefaciens TaxID=453960 RepID=A0A2T2XB53_9FIRM|nr:hypothetical protein [Bacillota bacterium]PSR31741.1 MAG: hypothetical protein C7B43_00505 [Sulfobacillus benefaciens]